MSGVHALSRHVLFCFHSELSVTNWAAQQLLHQPNGPWNMSTDNNALQNISNEWTARSIILIQNDFETEKSAL